MIQYLDPYAGRDAAAIYAMLTDPGQQQIPSWPPQEVQRLYTGAFGPHIVRSGLDFIDMLAEDGALAPGWKGLDYGAGFGRIASLMLSRGAPDQLDLADAWTNSIDYLKKGKFP